MWETSEEYNTSMKELKDDRNKKKDICSWIVRHNILRIPILPHKGIYRLNAIPTKITMVFCN